MSAPPIDTRASSPHSAATSIAVDDACTALVAIFEAAREQARTRLSSSQLQALLIVADDEGLTIGALAERMGLVVSSASRLADRLTAAGMVERGSSPVDRREVCLTLTAPGEELLSQLRAERHRRLAAVLARMSPAARTALLRGLREFGRAAEAGSEAGTEADPEAGDGTDPAIELTA